MYESLPFKNKARLYTYTCDLRSTDQIDKMALSIMDDVGVVTILVNNAGIVYGKYLMDLSYDEFTNVISVNLLAHFYLIQKFLPNMLGEAFPKYAQLKSDAHRHKQDKSKKPVYVDPSCATKPARGHIVCINSVAGCVPAPGLSDYCASKAGAILLSEGLREELDFAGLSNQVKVTNIMPYFINTGMFNGTHSK
ncbi:hypothetical protein Ciccas_013398 [Cichlidogyrus casuarinus]|uniref:Uncharacterized protein n=1 Tax=Cichlidogyrus casuarinus TaxID=1844966 RepID=A0ABD2PQR9_9PLAT